MPPPAPLQKLRHLDKFSPDFPDRLTKILTGQRYRDCVKGLQDEDISWLAEYLDDILRALQPASPAFRTCWIELRSICGARKALPQSHALPASTSLEVTERPISSGRSCDTHEGFLDGLKVSVKRLRIYVVDGPKDVRRNFCQEAVVWKRLVHPNIIPFLGATTTPFQLISEWIPCGDLLQFINTHPDADRLSIVSDIVDGLSYLHSLGVVHGDLKGSSILVNDTGHVRLTDFDLSGIVSDSGSGIPVTDDRAVRWAAPEVLEMKRPPCKASDVYSLAMVVIEVFTGKAPFYDKTPVAVAVDVLSGVRPERPAHPNFTDDLWDLTRRCWNHNSQQRPGVPEIAFRIRANSVSKSGGGTPDGTVSGREKEPPWLDHSPTLSAVRPHKPRRFFKFDRSPSASSLPQRNGRWFLGNRTSSACNHYDYPNGSSKKQVSMEDTVPTIPGRISFKGLLMQCSGTTMAKYFDH